MKRRAITALAMTLIVTGLAACAPLWEAGSTLAVTSSGGSVLLQWPNAIDYDEGQQIVEYRIDVDGVEVDRVPATARSCQLVGLGAGSHDVSVTAYDTAGEWSGSRSTDGRLSASVAGPTADPAGTAPGCIGYGETDPVVVDEYWDTIMATLPTAGSTAVLATCTPGTTAAAYRNAHLDKVNAYRKLSGAPPASEGATATAQAQAAALINAANGSINYNPPTSAACYTSTGATGASTGIHAAASGSPGGTPFDTTRLFMASTGLPTPNTNTLRRWVLCPGSTDIGFGKVYGGSAQYDTIKVRGGTLYPEGTDRDGLVAWPNPGLVQVDRAVSTGLATTFSAMFPNTYNVNGASVTMSTTSATPVSVQDLVPDQVYYCAPAVNWRPSRAPTAGETWTITISGVKDDTGATFTRVWTNTFVNAPA